MSITLAQICNAIQATLSAATGLTYTQSYDDLTEGVQDMPMLQVYWDSLSQDPGALVKGTERTTFKGGTRQTEIVVLADLYARQRAHIGEDMGALLPLIDAIQNVLEQQDTKPYFSLDGLKAFKWIAQRVIFEYGDKKFMGARFTITVRVF